jgi:hypothetical protein
VAQHHDICDDDDDDGGGSTIRLYISLMLATDRVPLSYVMSGESLFLMNEYQR